MGEASYILDNGGEVSCLETVRFLPGKRKVFLGEFKGEKVFVKLFLDPQRGEKHWTRELKGLDSFEKCQIKTANIIYSGKTVGSGLPIIILQHLTDAVSVKDAWEESNTEEKAGLLELMTILLARQHNSGLVQTDLHLDNFMLMGDEVISLDGAGVELSSDEVSRSGGVENLGLFMAQLYPKWESVVPEICRLYWRERGWDGEPDAELLLGQVQESRKRRWKKFRQKLYRDTTAFKYEKHTDGYRVAVRKLLSDGVSKLLDDIDGSFPGKDKAIKNGNSSTVWSAQVDGKSLVIKRYNPKGVWHAIKLWASQGRGGRSWVNSNRLLFYGIPTPQPVALVKRCGGIKPVMYKLTEQIDGISATHWFRDPGHSVDDKTYIAGKIAEAFSSLHKQMLTHGDMKASNILVSESQIWLIDLDAMRQHSLKATFNYARLSDISRFMENWSDDHELTQIFKNAFSSVGIEVA